MNNFEKLGLNEQIIQAITELGFENPTPVQEQAIPQLITQPKDFIGLAQTGTGKTAAYVLPILNKIIHTENRHLNTLIIAWRSNSNRTVIGSNPFGSTFQSR